MVHKVAGTAAAAAGEVIKRTQPDAFNQVMESAFRKPAAHPEAARHARAHGPAAPPARELVTEVSAAQAKLDHILKLAESGRTFSPAELLAFQAHAYRASQELDLAGKVVEKATSGVKQTLNTQV